LRQLFRDVSAKRIRVLGNRQLGRELEPHFAASLRSVGPSGLQIRRLRGNMCRFRES
jgi:hypothetical protein